MIGKGRRYKLTIKTSFTGISTEEASITNERKSKQIIIKNREGIR